MAEAGRPPMPDRPDGVGRPDPRDSSLGYAELGIERVVLGAGREGWDDPATALPFLDRYAALVPELSG